MKLCQSSSGVNTTISLFPAHIQVFLSVVLLQYASDSMVPKYYSWITIQERGLCFKVAFKCAIFDCFGGRSRSCSLFMFSFRSIAPSLFAYITYPHLFPGGFFSSVLFLFSLYWDLQHCGLRSIWYSARESIESRSLWQKKLKFNRCFKTNYINRNYTSYVKRLNYFF